MSNILSIMKVMIFEVWMWATLFMFRQIKLDNMWIINYYYIWYMKIENDIRYYVVKYFYYS